MKHSDPPPLPANLGPVLDFMRALWALDHAMGGRSRDICARFGITESERLVIRIVGQSPGISAGEMAAVLHVHPSTLTAVLQKLERRRALRRAADPLDRRRAILFLTDRGTQIDGVTSGVVDRAIRAGLARMAGSEVFAARRVLHAITEALRESPGSRRSRAPRSELRPRHAGPRGSRRKRKVGAGLGLTRTVKNGVAARRPARRGALGERPSGGGSAEHGSAQRAPPTRGAPAKDS